MTDERPLDRALSAAPPGAAAAIREWAARFARVAVHVPEPRFREFRLATEALIPEFAARMDDLRRGEADAALFALDSLGDRGLDEVETRALLDLWIHVDFVHRIATDEGFRILAGGTFREEHIGIAFTLDAEAFGRQRGHAAAVLTSLAGAGVVPAVFFTKARHARRLAVPIGRLARCVRRAAALGASPGVIVPVNRLFGFASAPRHASIVRRAWRAPARVVVRYEPAPAQAPDVDLMLGAVGLAGERFDATVPPGQPVDEHNLARWGAYLSAGAYAPQRFDLRTPAADWKDESSIVELVRVPYGEGLWHTWESLRTTPLRRLERLLDYFRIESYLRRITDVGLAQRYHEFRVYNWGSGDPNPRTLLLDCGPLGAFEDTARLIRDCARLRGVLGRRCHTDPNRFFDAALAEAKGRTVQRSADALRLQHEEHGYLETIDAASPLRADVVDFAASMPSSLGVTLELGAGFGQLAAELRGRSVRYIAVDLQPKMLETTARAADARGVIADFHHLPFAAGQFDSVVANNVLEHAYDPVAALREIRRTLKPGGALYALVPLDGLNPAYRLPAHLWKADLHAVRSAAGAAGLDVEAADAVSLYGMAIPASFPSCNGLVCRLRARRPGST